MGPTWLGVGLGLGLGLEDRVRVRVCLGLRLGLGLVRCLEVLDDEGHVVVPPARVLKFPLRALLLLLRQLRVHLG